MITPRQRKIDAKLRKSGRITTLRRTVAGKVTEYAAPCLFLSASMQGAGPAVGALALDLVVFAAYRVMLSPLVEVVPDVDTDEIQGADGKWLKVVSILPEQPANELLYYTLIVRI